MPFSLAPSAFLVQTLRTTLLTGFVTCTQRQHLLPSLCCLADLVRVRSSCADASMHANTVVCGCTAQQVYHDRRIFFAANNESANPYGLLASEYDVTTDTFRNLSSGIISNSLCSAVPLPALVKGLVDTEHTAAYEARRPCNGMRACTGALV